MPAMIVERAHFAGAVAQHDDALAIDLEQEVAARSFELRNVPDQQPRFAENALALELEDLGGHEVIARQRALAERRACFHGCCSLLRGAVERAVTSRRNRSRARRNA